MRYGGPAKALVAQWSRRRFTRAGTFGASEDPFVSKLAGQSSHQRVPQARRPSPTEFAEERRSVKPEARVRFPSSALVQAHRRIPY